MPGQGCPASCRARIRCPAGTPCKPASPFVLAAGADGPTLPRGVVGVLLGRDPRQEFRNVRADRGVAWVGYVRPIVHEDALTRLRERLKPSTPLAVHPPY